VIHQLVGVKTDVLCSDKKMRRDRSAKVIAENSFILPAAVEETAARRGRVRGRIARSEKNDAVGSEDERQQTYGRQPDCEPDNEKKITGASDHCGDSEKVQQPYHTSSFLLCWVKRHRCRFIKSTFFRIPLKFEQTNRKARLDMLTDKAVCSMIAEQARLRPTQIALASDAEQLSYADLERRASQLAHRLRALSAGPETTVAICLERSPQFVVAALAIMKCGAAYLPMDAGNPAERLRFIVADAGARLVVTQENLASRFANPDVALVVLDAAIDTEEAEFPAIDIALEDLAYVIYTSGSTGEPKGVEVTHRNLLNLIAWHVRSFGLDELTRATFQAGVGFDAAVWEIWPHLAIGAALHLPNESVRLSAEELRDWLVAEQITISFVPTVMAEQLIALPWPAQAALRFLLTGADTLHRYPPPELPFTLVNNYGPTECTVVATSGAIPANGNSELLPTIGSPIDNVQIHIADENLREVSNEAMGEIYIGGAGVSRGYRNRPRLTSERFIADSVRGRLYRTGDLGRHRPNGEIEFLGRIDDQIKIRGYRIELGEINSVLNKQPAVQSSIVIAREDVPGEKRLVAYVVPASDAQPDEESLRAAIRERLPDYMEPAAFVWMESLPLTPNGKIDRAVLPLPGLSANGKEFVAPRTPVEETLSEIIKEFLKLPRVSVDDDFFHLGAHSLLGAQIIARVRNVFGTELKLLDVFDAPTVAQLSVRIEDALTRKLGQMSEAEVDAALAALNEDANK
jgi:amino acid adenylation domain-containing protein